jgi:transcriptional regulator with XRE-family HTH domain
VNAPTSIKVWTEIRDRRALEKLMDNKGISVRAMADLVTRELRRTKKKGQRTAISKSTISALRSGTAKVTSPEVALAISEILDIPRDLLFLDRVSTYTNETAQRKRAA